MFKSVIVVKDFNLLMILLVMFGFGLQTFMCKVQKAGLMI